jgi:hypothetical protein
VHINAVWEVGKRFRSLRDREWPCRAVYKHPAEQRTTFGMSACCNAASGGLNAPIYPVGMSPAGATGRAAPDGAVGRGKPGRPSLAALARPLDGVLPSGCRAARLPLARLLSIYVDVVGNRSPIAIAGGQPVRRRGVRISAEVYLCVTNQGPSRHPAPRA